jgi:hypothetical protein
MLAALGTWIQRKQPPVLDDKGRVIPLTAEAVIASFPRISSWSDWRGYRAQIASCPPYLVEEYNIVDVLLCALQGVPCLLHFHLHGKFPVLMLGVGVIASSVLADGLQMVDYIHLDRIMALSSVSFWFFYGISLSHQFSYHCILLQLFLLFMSIACQQLAMHFFYFSIQPDLAITMHRLWHIGGSASMLFLVVQGGLL